jgi:hypothetical protein
MDLQILTRSKKRALQTEIKMTNSFKALSRVLDLGKFLSDLKCSTIFFVYQTRVRFYISAYTRCPLI